jgi:hypothetical protein
LRPAVPLVACVAVAVALAGTYVALGGTSYEPTPVADPCAPRPVRETSGTGERVEVVLLAAADETACELGVSREDLVLAVRSEEALDRFAREQGISREDAEDAVTDGLVRAVDDAEEAGVIDERVASLARRVVEAVPPWLVLQTLESLDFLLPD